MKDSEKTILAFYIEMGNLPPEQHEMYLETQRSKLKFDDSVIVLMFAKMGDRRSLVECLNPKTVVKNKSEIEKILRDLEKQKSINDEVEIII
jgi:hypothetical protein